MSTTSSIVAIATLGIWHGINPGMGWLFAVALGLQQGRARAVWLALPPLALGHAVAVAGALGAAVMLESVVSATALKFGVAAMLFAFGMSRLARSRHPRYGGMIVGARDLVVWSSLMATAHGAGLMLVPFATVAATSNGHRAHMMALGVSSGSASPAIEATAVHTLAYLVTTALVAAVVYWRLGVRILRTHWINLDLIWSGALIVTAIVCAAA